MRRISFAMTQQQVLDRTKTVTRRLGWRKLKAGELLLGVDRVMGFKPGQKAVRLAVVRVTKVTRELLGSITQADTKREGFAYLTPGQFVGMFCLSMKCKPHTEVTRIEFEYVLPDSS